jgi:hypothetical protein
MAFSQVTWPLVFTYAVIPDIHAKGRVGYEHIEG